MNTKTETVIFGGGCFWCTEAVFKELKGVVSVMPGYSGGKTENPTYEQVCNGDTGHIEVIKIEYNPSEVSFEDLLTVFFATHDPTTKDRQGNDIGKQYRSVVFYTSDKQKNIIQKFINDINSSSGLGKPVITEIRPLDKFYNAENYHKDYFARNPGNPYCQAVINPKLRKVKEKFAKLLK